MLRFHKLHLAAALLLSPVALSLAIPDSAAAFYNGSECVVFAAGPFTLTQTNTTKTFITDYQFDPDACTLSVTTDSLYVNGDYYYPQYNGAWYPYYYDGTSWVKCGSGGATNIYSVTIDAGNRIMSDPYYFDHVPVNGVDVCPTTCTADQDAIAACGGAEYVASVDLEACTYQCINPCDYVPGGEQPTFYDYLSTQYCTDQGGISSYVNNCAVDGSIDIICKDDVTDCDTKETQFFIDNCTQGQVLQDYDCNTNTGQCVTAGCDVLVSACEQSCADQGGVASWSGVQDQQTGECVVTSPCVCNSPDPTVETETPFVQPPTVPTVDLVKDLPVAPDTTTPVDTVTDPNSRITAENTGKTLSAVQTQTDELATRLDQINATTGSGLEQIDGSVDAVRRSVDKLRDQFTVDEKVLSSAELSMSADVDMSLGSIDDAAQTAMDDAVGMTVDTAPVDGFFSGLVSQLLPAQQECVPLDYSFDAFGTTRTLSIDCRYVTEFRRFFGYILALATFWQIFLSFHRATRIGQGD